jgi:diguanylate cyclase (GGDEF)-like protein
MISQSAIHSARILLVDDLFANVKVLEYMLSDAGYTNVSSTMDSREVLELHRTNRYDLIVLDLNMPFMNGFDVLEGLRLVESEGYLPVLAVTAEPTYELRALESGAKDFVSKPFNHIEVLTRIRNLLEVRLLYTEMRDYGLHLARYDTLTGLPNRFLFQQRLVQALAAAQDSGGMVAMLLIDLDGFKHVNDTLGHVIGDDLLRQFAGRLEALSPTRGRLGGDEFGLILACPDGLHQAQTVAQKLRCALAAPFDLEGSELRITASIGIAVAPDDGGNADTLIKYAETAMYQAKQAGRDTHRFFTEEMNVQAQKRLWLATALHKAINDKEFVLLYQPKVQISTGHIVGAEALLRWNRPGHGMISPADFIPILEETGLIVGVGQWVIAEACRQIAAWMPLRGGPIPIAVNVASRQFASGDLGAVVADAITVSGIAPGMLELEVTESALMVDMERTNATLRTLREMGIRIAIDDFGTGYSSLAYLKHFPIDTLKIDIAFIRDVTTDPGSAAIVKSIISMAHSMKMDVIAEGVETAEQLVYLRRNHCDHLQGFYFSRPVPAEQFERLLLDETRLAIPEGRTAMLSRTLLIVHDDPDELASLDRLLRPDGYHILTAASAEQGFALLALHQVQVIMCDQKIAGVGATGFLDKVKDMYPDNFRIVLSSHADLAMGMQAINRGALHRFFTKPLENATLRADLRATFRDYWQMRGMAPDEAEARLQNAIDGDELSV